MNEKIIKTITEALRSARSIEELADALLTAGVTFADGEQMQNAECKMQNHCSDCISRSEPLGIIDRAMETNSLKASRAALRLFRETVENLSSVIPTCIKESCAELEAMRSAANSFKIHNAKLSSENDRLRGVIKILESDVAARDRLLEAKVEAVYPEFMRDYKQIREELEEIYKENDNAEDNDKHDN